MFSSSKSLLRQLHYTHRISLNVVFCNFSAESEKLKRSKSAESENQSNAIQVTKLGAVANVGLAFGKGVTGYSIGSTALIADAANSLGDIMIDVIVYMSIVQARKKATSKRPWGSGKLEPLGALAVSAIVIGTGGGVGYTAYEALHGIYFGLPEAGQIESGTLMGSAAIAVSVASIVCKEALFHYTLKVGRASNSASVVANAWQHRADALISGAALAGLVGAMSGYKYFDPLAALFVSGMILKGGWAIGSEAVEDLRDSPASEDELDLLRKSCAAVPGILDVPEMLARRSGPYLFVECTVTVPGLMSLSAAHRLAAMVKDSLLTNHHGRVANAVVDVEPQGVAGLGEKAPLQFRDHDQVSMTAIQVLQRIPGIVAVKDVRVHYLDDGFLMLEIGIHVSSNLTISDARDVATKARGAVAAAIPGVREADVDIDIDMQSLV